MDFIPSRVYVPSAEELYLFDTMGFVKFPHFLARETADECRTEVLRLSSRLMKGRGDKGRGDKERFDDLVERSPSFSSLARNEVVLGCVEPVINQPLRLIESYALRRIGVSRFYLHNGYSEILSYGRNCTARRNMSFSHTYHDGKLYCMFVKLLIYLTDVHTVEDGPFCYLQGSHKANFPWFPNSKSFTGQLALTQENFPSLAFADASTGDAILLNEALFHGTLPKTTDSERLVLAFSYAPAFVTNWKEIDIESNDIAKLGHY